MRNRAKCKLCNDVIESLNDKDQIECKCGEITVFGGNNKMGCMAKNWDNFLRVDENGNVIQTKVVEKSPPTKDELVKILDTMIDKIEDMPPVAMNVAITHYDFVSLLYWIRALTNLIEERKVG